VCFKKKIIGLLFIIGLFSFHNPTEKDVLFFVDEYCKDFYTKHDVKQLLFVSIKQQKIYLIRHGHMVTSYPISTSKFGLGNIENSKKTPLGLHIIERKIGKGIPSRGIIKAGVYTGEQVDLEHYPVTKEGDFVTSRLMWLKGMEPGNNLGGIVDSYKRRIYIHGTPEEGLIGKPSSHGCIRMNNHQIIELFNLVEKGLFVLILNV
tara:strand:+ start:1762 stop:2376 length:615 start_codon:yes stop_codon:yes gene_type:complete